MRFECFHASTPRAPHNPYKRFLKLIRFVISRGEKMGAFKTKAPQIKLIELFEYKTNAIDC